MINRSKAITEGLARYHSGLPCPKGHVCERFTSNGNCVKCIKLRKAAWRDTDTGKQRRQELRKEWHVTEAGRRSQRVRTARHQDRKKGAYGHYTARDIDVLIINQCNQCTGCSTSFNLVAYTIDHIVPLSRGGSSWPNNLQLLCRSCNSNKCDKLMCEWIRTG